MSCLVLTPLALGGQLQLASNGYSLETTHVMELAVVDIHKVGHQLFGGNLATVQVVEQRRHELVETLGVLFLARVDVDQEPFQIVAGLVQVALVFLVHARSTLDDQCLLDGLLLTAAGLLLGSHGSVRSLE